MTQEEKQLLLKDLCARLPYGVKVHGVFLNYNKNKDKILYEECDNNLNYAHLNRYESLKPYLRLMSSMTEEEYREFLNTQSMESGDGSHPKYEYSYETFDWLNAHHFDYRGLIEKGLALPAKENMYND